MTDLDDDGLNKGFARMRAAAASPSPDLLDRVMNDALREQRHVSVGRDNRRVNRHAKGFWAGLIAPFGGLPTVAGICCAATFGLALGYADPTTSTYLLTGSTDDGIDTVDFFFSLPVFSTEG